MKVFVYLWVAVMMAACTSAGQGYVPIDPARLEELMGDSELQLLDVRTPEEVAAGYIPGASHIDIYDKEFATKVGQLDKTKPLAVYCAAGGRSATAGEQLIELGFTQVYDLVGGYRGWLKAGKPTTRD